MHKIYYILFLIFVLFFSIELLCQFFFADPLIISDLLIKKEPPLYFSTKPNARIDYKGCLIKIEKTRIEINSLGFRDKEPDLDDKRPQINIYGDSQTFGLGVSHEATFANQLQNKLPAYKINNYAVPGYNFSQMYYLHKMNNYNIALNVFVIFNNDFSKVIGICERPYFYDILKRCFLYQLIYIIKYVVMIEDNINLQKYEYEKAILFLNGLENENNKVLFLFLDRPRFDIEMFERKVKECFCLVDGQYIYTHNKINKDEHLNAKGHKLIADKLYKEIMEKNILL